ncbi:MAG TPA: hypothetical protein VK304_07275 [Thermoleophilaceae bacterium]|nr:hypothetical protein [Thermoleophilaceae bacterium]
MSKSDIRPLGAGDGIGRYWIKQSPGLPGAVGSLRLVLVDEAGKTEYTPLAAPWDDAAMTKDEAVQAHLRGAVAEADRDLERRRREAPALPEKPSPPDRATQRFLDDGDR